MCHSKTYANKSLQNIENVISSDFVCFDCLFWGFSYIHLKDRDRIFNTYQGTYKYLLKILRRFSFVNFS